ncbi:response regulator transcription factor, partial [Streptomyces sp. SID7982]|nr:response regulator transcription factor [Streptomyces sp. SID7982]
MNTPASPTPPASSAPVRLLIVDDDPLVRAGLTLMLGGDQGIDIVGEGADGVE